MTNESVTTKKAAKRGSAAKQLGAVAMVIGVVFALMAGSFGAVPMILFFGGLVLLIVGIAQRNSDAT